MSAHISILAHVYLSKWRMEKCNVLTETDKKLTLTFEVDLMGVQLNSAHSRKRFFCFRS